MEDKWDEDTVMIEREDIKDFNEDNILPLSPNTISQIKTWLNPTEYDDKGSEYQKHLSSHLAGTGQWVFESVVYRQWHESQKDSVLWIRGMASVQKD